MICVKVYNLDNIKFSPVTVNCRTKVGISVIVAKLMAAYKWQLIPIEVPNDGPQYDAYFAMRSDPKRGVVGIMYREDPAPPELNLNAGVA